MAVFNPNTDLKIEVSPRGELYDLRSNGLAKFGRKELVIEGVPESQVRNAGALINLVSTYVVDTSVDPGERLGLELGRWVPIVTLFEAEDEFQRIADGHVETDDGQPPKAALTTVGLERAQRSLADGNQAQSLMILEESLEFYPGEPLADQEPLFGLPYNWQNCLTYKALADQFRGENSRGFLHRACDRSLMMQGLLLGAPIDHFASVTADDVSNRAAHIHHENVATRRTEAGPNDEVVITVSPIWTLGDDDAVARSAAMIPKKLLGHYWSDDAVEGLSDSSNLGLIGEAVEAYADDPVSLAARVSEARHIWTDPSAPEFQFEEPFVDGDTLVSSVLAHVARLLVVGAEIPELRVSLGLVDDPEAQARLEERLSELDAIERSAFGMAMS